MTRESNQKTINDLFRQATSLRDAGRLEDAVKILTKLLEMDPERKAPILGTLGHVYFKLRDLNNALVCYSEAVSLSPKSELGSLGLFHTLWDMGRPRDAYEEAKRFLSISESKEYLMMIDEMIEAFKAEGIDLNSTKVGKPETS